MTVSRRDLLLGCTLAPILLPGASQFLVLQPRAILIGNKPVFLVSGTIDYFRCPHELWRDHLLRAKRSGLNTIAFCVAWNFHEREEGVFDFEGDCDIGHFLDLCRDLGLYAFPRVGPFICDEWDAGGYPAWLVGKPVVELRAWHESTLRYVHRWFEKLIPQIAKRQVTKGGPVVLVQQENEYYYVDRPGVREYQDFLIRTMRDLGIEVPITDCNGFSPQIRRPSSMQTINGGGAANVDQLRKAQPGKPVLISELYTDYSNCWGWPVSSYPTADMVYQQTMETLARGGMYNYFMFYGGTNFGFWASTTWKSDQSFITTRYYGRAPLAEGGALNDSYFAAKATNLLASNFEEFLTAGEEAPNPLVFDGPVRAEAVRTPLGCLLFVHPRFPMRDQTVYRMDGRGPAITLEEEWPMAELASQPGTFLLPSGDRVELAEQSSYPSMLPFQLDIDPDGQIDYSNATLMGVAGAPHRRILILRGDAGRHGIVSVNGKRADFVFPSSEIARLETGGVTVLALPRALADRTWFADGRVLIGPAYVGAMQNGLHECFIDGRTVMISTISSQGEMQTKNIESRPDLTFQMRLKDWISRPLPQLVPLSEGWRLLDQPVGVEELEAYWGYTWYRAWFTSQEPRTASLLFTEAGDRIHVFVNGKRMGVWGRGRGAVRDPLPVEMIAGENQFVFLCDNMGRLSEGKCLDRKGIRGPAYLDAAIRPLDEPRWSSPEAPPTKSWEYQTYRGLWSGEAGLLRATYEIKPRFGEGLLLSLRSLPQYAWITLDGEFIGEHAGDLSLAGGIDFSSFVLDGHLKPSPMQLEITLFGEPSRDIEEHVRLLSYPKERVLDRWAFHSWRVPEGTGPALAGYPACWEFEFAKPAAPGPIFLVTQGLSKGQAWLNGRPVGRYWEIGPQHSLYLPEPWFQPGNRLLIFDEEGKSPGQTYLMRDSRVPVRSVWA